MRKQALALAFAASTLAIASLAVALPIERSVGGDNTTASILATVNQFRTDLGNPNNGNTPGPLPSGRREINWDGGGAATTVSLTPFAGFQNIRGALFNTPGTGFVQAPLTGFAENVANPSFGNPTYGSTFGVFSLQRLFSPIGSNITDVTFYIPGTNGSVAAAVTGFGAVFTDVDFGDSTSLQFFDLDNALLGTFDVPDGTVPDGSLSFLGVSFTEGAIVSRVRITSGNAALGPNDGGSVDVVVMDDFIFGEPQRIPEPGILLLMAVAFGGLALARRKKV